jgi:hypothetical protein
MANERMVPLLPCASVDEMRDFYRPLGFEVTYRQLRPNPYLGLRREDLVLHYFGIDGFKPEDSYGSCLVVVADTEPLFEAFAAGLRAQFGKLPLTGFPRITRPRRRRNAGNLSGFSLVDPSGNWIRVVQQPPAGHAGSAAEAPGSRLAQALANAVVLADSKGDVDQAAKILRGALSRDRGDAARVERLEALAYLAELSVRLDDGDRARELLDEIGAVDLSAAEREAAASALGQARDLRESLADPAERGSR